MTFGEIKANLVSGNYIRFNRGLPCEVEGTRKQRILNRNEPYKIISVIYAQVPTGLSIKMKTYIGGIEGRLATVEFHDTCILSFKEHPKAIPKAYREKLLTEIE